MAGIIKRLFRGAIGTFEAWAWGADGGPSMPLMKLAHDGDKVVDAINPLFVADDGLKIALQAQAKGTAADPIYGRTPTKIISQGFNRPANVTPYAIGDAVAGAAANTWLMPLDLRDIGGAAWIRRAKLTRGTPLDYGAQFRLWFFDEAVDQVADNDPFVMTYAGARARRGYAEFATSIVPTAGSNCTEYPGVVPGGQILLKPPTGIAWMGLTTTTAYAPSAGVQGDAFGLDVVLEGAG